MQLKPALLALAFFVSCAVSSQDMPSTVGDLLSKGGTQVSAADLKALLSGATISGTQMTTTTKFRNTYKADGSIDGTAVTEGSPPMTMGGTWTVLSGGVVVSDYRPSTGREFQGRAFWFKLGDRYFQASGTATFEKVMVREVTR